MDIGVLQLVGYITGALILGIGIMIFKFKGFFFAWFSVTRSAGTKLLVEIANPLQDYFRAGSVQNGFLRYKAIKRADNPSPNRMIYIGDINAVVYNKFGVKCINVDDEKGCVFSRHGEQYKSTIGFNAEKVDEAVQTALIKPSLNNGLMDPKTWQIICLITIAILVIADVILFSAINGVSKHVGLVSDQIGTLINYTIQHG